MFTVALYDWWLFLRYENSGKGSASHFPLALFFTTTTTKEKKKKKNEHYWPPKSDEPGALTKNIED